MTLCCACEEATEIRGNDRRSEPLARMYYGEEDDYTTLPKVGGCGMAVNTWCVRKVRNTS